MSSESDLSIMTGEPKRAIRSMMVPFLVSILVVQVNVFADTFWVSGLGVNAVSGMTTAVPLYAIFTSIGMGLSVGVTATVAFRIGKKDFEAAERIVGSAVFLALVLSVVCSVLMFLLTDPLIRIMGAEDVGAEVHEYVFPFLLMSPSVVMLSMMGGLLRAEGAAKRSTLVQMSCAVINMILDPIFIYILGLGIFGAALATTVSSLLAVCIALNWYIRRKTVIRIVPNYIRPAREPAFDLMSVAGPRTVEGLVMNITILVQRVFIIIAGGTVGVALFNVPFRYVTLSQSPAEATGMAMVPVVASAYGRSSIGDMKTAMFYALRLALLFSLTMMVIMFILADPLISLFTMEETMAEWHEEFLWNMRVYCIILPLFTIQVLCSSMLQAVKRAKKTVAINLFLGFARVFMFWLASYYDFKAITIALVISYILSATLMATLARMELKRIFGSYPNCA